MEFHDEVVVILSFWKSFVQERGACIWGQRRKDVLQLLYGFLSKEIFLVKFSIML